MKSSTDRTKRGSPGRNSRSLSLRGPPNSSRTRSRCTWCATLSPAGKMAAARDDGSWATSWVAHACPSGGGR